MTFYKNGQLKEGIGEQRGKCNKEMKSNDAGSKKFKLNIHGAVKAITDGGNLDVATLA